MKKRSVTTYLIALGILLLFTGIILVLWKYKDNKNEYIILDSQYYSYKYISTYDEYLQFKEENSENNFYIELDEDNFKGPYLLFTINVDSCSEKIVQHFLDYNDNFYKLYLDVSYGCGVCPPIPVTYIYKAHTPNMDGVTFEVYTKTVSKETCDPNVAYKPIIYIYPTEELDLTIKLGNPSNLKYTYPQYNNIWNVRVSPDGNIYDYNTDRNYYGLYWEAYDYYKLDMSKGFVVKKEDTIKFLEDKLAILGLNEYEINEFIIYWIDKLDNNYNFISFRSIEDVNKTMPIEFSKEPDTLIRVMVDFKGLDEYIEVEEQELKSVNRSGFTVVEWGGSIH